MDMNHSIVILTNNCIHRILQFLIPWRHNKASVHHVHQIEECWLCKSNDKNRERKTRFSSTKNGLVQKWRNFSVGISQEIGISISCTHRLMKCWLFWNHHFNPCSVFIREALMSCNFYQIQIPCVLKWKLIFRCNFYCIK